MRLVQNVAFDLDGTLVDLHSIFQQELVSLTGARIIPQNNFRIKTEPHVSDKVIWECFKRAYQRYKEIMPMLGAVEVLKALYKLTGEPPMIVTARPHWAANDTYRLLDNILDIPCRVSFARGNRKIQFLSGVDYFVDDRRRIAIELSLAGKYVYVPSAHYNQMNFKMDNIEHIKGVCELLPIVESLCKVMVCVN